MFADDVVLKAAVALATNGAELPLPGVGRLMAAQVGRLGEAFSTGGALVRPDIFVHQCVASQMTSMVEAPSTDITGELLLKVGHLVSLQHADGGVTLTTDVTVAAFLACVPTLDVQVEVWFVVEPLWAVFAGVRLQSVIFDLMFTKSQDAGESFPTH